MIKQLKQLAGDSIIYGLSSIATRFIAIFLIPVYTRIFNPTDYGIMNLVNTTYYLIGIVIVFALDNSTAIWYWKENTESGKRKVFATWFWFQNWASLLFAILSILFAKQLSLLILSDSSYWLLFVLNGIAQPFLATHRVVQNWYRYRRKASKTVLFSLFISLLTIGLSILFVVIYKLGIPGIFWAQLVSAVVGFFLFLLSMKGWYNFRLFSMPLLRDMLKFALPLIPATVSFWLLNSAGTFFLEKYCSKTEVGLFQIGVSFASIVNIVVMAFGQAWPPFALSISNQKGHQNIFANVYILYVILGSICCTIIGVFSKELLVLFTQPDYYSANFVINILALNVFISGITTIISIGPNLAKDNRPYGYGVIIASVFSVLLYIFLIPYFKKEGAAFAMLAGNIILVIYLAYKAQKLYYVPYQWLQSVLYIGLCAIVVFASTNFTGFVSKILFLIPYFIILFITLKKRMTNLLAREAN